ncbi:MULTISPECIES: alpha/beta fold hydrolase [Gordonibacter]|uniref:Putative 2-succinyl-6-hydroxy-2,4-cyclohexadiene-1-carboxylate synthase n=1 Tax=Gordonibacter faecis TaxID=3047475 RepID=A0ABT7DP98_9ACTN|nr:MULTISPECIES: alpha/beta fold hydrolase [unclassified Gordonibacter]MDJ1651356.1 alpha/beta fold hydrolase [Gordonibacter sp. KGMB12511]
MEGRGERGFFAYGAVRHRFVRWCGEGDVRDEGGALGDGGCGEGDREEEHAGVPLVLVHGFAQSAASWEGVASQLASGRAVYAFELVGHGGSDCPDDEAAYELSAQAEALLAFLDYVAKREAFACGAGSGGETRPVVVGYSLGGRVALTAACRDAQAFAQRVSDLVLESAGLGPATSDERAAAAERDATNAERLRDQGLEAFMDAWERLPLFATQRALPPEVRERVRAGRLANNAEALALTFLHAGQHVMPARDEVLSTLKQLADQDVPVLYLAGSLDEKYRLLAESLEAQNLCTITLITPAGHNIHLEAPAQFCETIHAFTAAASR